MFRDSAGLLHDASSSCLPVLVSPSVICSKQSELSNCSLRPMTPLRHINGRGVFSCVPHPIRNATRGVHRRFPFAVTVANCFPRRFSIDVKEFKRVTSSMRAQTWSEWGVQVEPERQKDARFRAWRGTTRRPLGRSFVVVLLWTWVSHPAHRKVLSLCFFGNRHLLVSRRGMHSTA